MPDQTQALSVVPNSPAAVSSLQILEAAVRGGITSENVAVVEKLMTMRREELSSQNKAVFNQAFFRLKKEISGMSFYADKEAKNDSGKVVFRYCSEAEISEKLEFVLLKHGFTMAFGQRQENERVVSEITLIHEGGHEEKREYAVRLGTPNRMKDATQTDAGSATSAWRHLVIKWFGLKSRIKDTDDAHNLGDKITKAQADSIRKRMAALMEAGKANESKFFDFAGAKTYEEIMSVRLSSIETMLQQKERAKPASPSQCGTPQDALAAILNAAGYTFDEFRAWAEDEGQWPDASSAATIYECPAAVAKAMVGNKAALLAGLAEHTGRGAK